MYSECGLAMGCSIGDGFGNFVAKCFRQYIKTRYFGGAVGTEVFLFGRYGVVFDVGVDVEGNEMVPGLAKVPLRK